MTRRSVAGFAGADLAHGKGNDVKTRYAPQSLARMDALSPGFKVDRVGRGLCVLVFAGTLHVLLLWGAVVLSARTVQAPAPGAVVTVDLVPAADIGTLTETSVNVSPPENPEPEDTPTVSEKETAAGGVDAPAALVQTPRRARGDVPRDAAEPSDLPVGPRVMVAPERAGIDGVSRATGAVLRSVICGRSAGESPAALGCDGQDAPTDWSTHIDPLAVARVETRTDEALEVSRRLYGVRVSGFPSGLPGQVMGSSRVQWGAAHQMRDRLSPRTPDPVFGD